MNRSGSAVLALLRKHPVEPKTDLIVVFDDADLDAAADGDVLLIANAGAYGHVMSSNYNLRPPAAELVLPA